MTTTATNPVLARLQELRAQLLAYDDVPPGDYKLAHRQMVIVESGLTHTMIADLLGVSRSAISIVNSGHSTSARITRELPRILRMRFEQLATRAMRAHRYDDALRFMQRMSECTSEGLGLVDDESDDA